MAGVTDTNKLATSNTSKINTIAGAEHFTHDEELMALTTSEARQRRQGAADSVILPEASSS